ncbi:hypothetical protein MJ560_07095 [Klebsiella pneumoniae]|nr:hypothetical protein MJ560_07095 [Klebsiella pneumoniae]
MARRRSRSDLQRRERQQETALAAMKRFRWQAIVALLVGVPVMVWEHDRR